MSYAFSLHWGLGLIVLPTTKSLKYLILEVSTLPKLSSQIHAKQPPLSETLLKEGLI